MAAPVVKKPADQTGNVSTVITPLQLEVTSGEAFKWSATGLPAGLSVNTTSGLITGTPTTNESVEPSLKAENVGTEVSATVKFKWEIKIALPVVTKPERQNSRKGESDSLSVSSTGSPTEYKASGLPAGLSINATTGEITGTPTARGTSKVKLSTVNAGGTSASVEFEWEVIESVEEDRSNNLASTWVATTGWLRQS